MSLVPARRKKLQNSKFPASSIAHSSTLSVQRFRAPGPSALSTQAHISSDPFQNRMLILQPRLNPLRPRLPASQQRRAHRMNRLSACIALQFRRYGRGVRTNHHTLSKDSNLRDRYTTHHYGLFRTTSTYHRECDRGYDAVVRFDTSGVVR